MLKTGDTFEQGGRTWRFVGVGEPGEGQSILDQTGVVFTSWQRNRCLERIVEEVVPEWIVPTDEHAKQRLECEVRDNNNEIWRRRTLVYVRSYSASHRFLTDTREHGYVTWTQCRIRNPEYKPE